jgi:uncharacterized protein (DUF1499 family)
MWIILIVLFILLDLACIRLYLQNKKPPSLGLNNGYLSELPTTPNAVSTQTNIADKKVAPLPFKSDMESTMSALVSAIHLHGSAKIITQNKNYLYAVFTSKRLKFNDDVEFYLDQKNQLVHFRSASRAGKSDLGVNKKRYLALAELYSHQE